MFDTAETAWEMEEARARLRGGGDGGGYGGGDDDERGWSASREVAREAAERDAMHAGDVDEDGDVDDGIVAEMTRLLCQNWAFWLPAQFAQFAVVPPGYHILYVSGMGLAWNTILSLRCVLYTGPHTTASAW